VKKALKTQFQVTSFLHRFVYPMMECPLAPIVQRCQAPFPIVEFVVHLHELRHELHHEQHPPPRLKLAPIDATLQDWFCSEDVELVEDPSQLVVIAHPVQEDRFHQQLQLVAELLDQLQAVDPLDSALHHPRPQSQQ
jgi:hypothetical protein